MEAHDKSSTMAEIVAGQNSQEVWSFKPENIIKVQGLCYDDQGWKILDPQGNLTSCFIDGVVAIVPALYMILVGFFGIRSLLRSTSKGRSNSWIYVLKLFLVSLQIFLSILTALVVYYKNGGDIRTWSVLINSVALFQAFTLHFLDDGRSLVPPDSLLIYWPLFIISQSMKVFHLTTSSDTLQTFTSYFLLNCFSLLNSVLIFLFEYVWPKIHQDPVRIRRTGQESIALIDTADVYDRLTLSWINPLITEAAENKLKGEDLPLLDRNYSSATCTDRFLFFWQARKDNHVTTLVWCLMRSFGKSLFLVSLYEELSDLIAFTQPFLLRSLILFVQSYWTGDDPKPVSIGIYISMGMFAVSLTRMILSTKMFLNGIMLMSSVRAALNSVVYMKAIDLSPREREQRSTGQIVNILATDVQTIVNASYMFNTIWQAPVQFILCLYSLNILLGRSMWAGFAVLAVFAPINYVLTQKMKKMRRNQMDYKDQRTKLLTEIMSSIKSLKLYGWEHALLDRLRYVRNTLQLRNLAKLIMFSSNISFIWTLVPYMISISTFACYIYIEKKPLTTDIVFPAVSLFSIMKSSISSIPKVFVTLIDSSVSFTRVRDFLIADERQKNAIGRLPSAQDQGQNSVVFSNATLSWDVSTPDNIALDKIDFAAHKGELSCIVGRVGSGKTSFLRAMLGDLYLKQGSIDVCGSIAYVSQDVWLMNATVKENILFGFRFDPEFYYKTIEACALLPDLEILPDGDETEIGEMGISLSGGQKARINLARAVYARADVYLLDDPLSAVDEHVGSHISLNVIGSKGLLKSKTRILSTNSINILSQAHNISLLRDNTIVERGSYQEVMQLNGSLKDLITEFGRTSSSNESAIEEGEAGPEHLSNGHIRIGSNASVKTLRKASMASFKRQFKSKDRYEKKRTAIQKEVMNQGKVKWSVYTKYAEACGFAPIIFTIFLLMVYSGSSLVSSLWLKNWSENNSSESGNLDPVFYLGIYMAIGIAIAGISVLRQYSGRILCGITASRKLYEAMATNVLRCPMSFFETTPLGRIINRFSSDVGELDEGLPSMFMDLLMVVFNILVSFGVIIFSTPVVILTIIPLSFIYYYYQNFYIRASRQLKRLLVTSRSPLFAHCQETLTGVATIRAFGQAERFRFINNSNLDYYIRAGYLYRNNSRWLSFRLQSIGSIITFVTGCAIVYAGVHKKMSPGLIGVVMGYTVTVIDNCNWIVKSIVSVETSVIGVERILEYCNLPTEADEVVEGHRPPAKWPSKGGIVFKDYSARYRENLDLILKDINLNILPKEKIGVVGRTGAGKSSLIMALFRIIEPASGSISIEDVDISSIGLLDLRSKLSIIPQDSQVFQGTIRQNLDPLQLYSDEEIWKVLEHCHLKEHLTSKHGLESVLSEGGSNLSSGQRQLMCLGRALLRTSKVLVLDEATASVDVETDKLVQQTIRSKFNDCTIVTIAHRLNTIMDSDRIVVLDEGKVAEFNTPEKLLNDKSSMFYALCSRGGFTQSEEPTKVDDDGSKLII